MASGNYAKKPVSRAPGEKQLTVPLKARATAKSINYSETEDKRDLNDSHAETLTFTDLPFARPSANQTTLTNRSRYRSLEATTTTSRTGLIRETTTSATGVSSTSSIKTVTLPQSEAYTNTLTSPIKTATMSRVVDVEGALRRDIPLPHPLGQHQSWIKPWVICVTLVVISLIVLITAGMYQRPSQVDLSLTGGGQTYSIQVGGDQAGQWQQPKQMPVKKPIPVQAGPYSVVGEPSLNAAFINKVLAAYNSPAAGKGQELYDMGMKYGIDPAFALAFFMHESSFGTQGEAHSSLSLGNLRCIPNYVCRDGYAWFNSWEDGFQAWYELIRNLYVADWGLTTVDQIIPRYAPPADNNNDDAYISSLKNELNTWHSGQVIVN